MIKTEYAVLTNAGGRGINEDTVLAIPSSLGLVVTVADGLGGHGEARPPGRRRRPSQTALAEGFAEPGRGLSQPFTWQTRRFWTVRPRPAP